MNRHPRKPLLALLLLPFVLGQCSTQKPGEGHAVLFAQSKGRAFENYSAYVVIKSVDGKEAAIADGRRGIKITPGEHRVVVTARRDVGENAGGWILGLTGALIGAAIDSSHSQWFEEALALTAVGGQRYIAKLRDDGRSYRFWIENERTGNVASRPRARRSYSLPASAGRTEFLR
jgi:hypothetical protein